MTQYDTVRAIQWDDNHLVLLDQRKLPHAEQYVHLYNAEDTAEAIRNMVVRGAPAIGIAAAYGVAMAARRCFKQYPEQWRERLLPAMATLAEARPTAVNLNWALQRMQTLINSELQNPSEQLLALSEQIHQEDIAANYHMGQLGASFIQYPTAVITHCNTGSLATGGYGTALGVIRNAFGRGKVQRVYADETRPWWQGARLTAWELARDAIPVKLMCEGAAAHLMKQGEVSWIIVGSDRIAANGDVANKIGTYSLAVNARFHGVKVMVVAPTSTIDMKTARGEQIPIEERPQEEVLNVHGQRLAAPQVEACNPAFDITPARLVDVLVTEKGTVLRPDAEKMTELMDKA